MPAFETHYRNGQRQALLKFAGGSAEDLVDLLGGVSPGAAALGAGFTAPEGYGLGHAARAGVGSLAGGTVGERGGEAAGALLARLLKQNPELFERIGGAMGKGLGGAAGARAGRVWAQDATTKDIQKQQMGG